MSKQPATVAESQALLTPIGGTNPAPSKQSLIQRIGVWQTCFLILSFVAIFGSLGFLCFLWGCSHRNVVWRSICLAGWITRSVTIAALLIRVSITTQAASCTAMLTALLLFRFRVLLPDTAAMAITQFHNTGPHFLITPLYRSVRLKRGFAVALLVVALLTSTTLLQFTSTILLSDTSLTYVLAPNQHDTIPYAFVFTTRADDDDISYYGQYGYWEHKPASYPAFAEYSEAVRQHPGFNASDSRVYDTGLVMRALLPISAPSQRETLQTYSGNATVMDMRVVCMKPDLEDLMVETFQNPGKLNGPAGPVIGPVISGRIAGFKDAAVLINPPGMERLSPFNCSSAVDGSNSLQDQEHGMVEWPLALCRINQTSGIFSEMNPGLSSSEMAYYDEAGLNEANLVINVSGSNGRWLDYQYDSRMWTVDGGPPLQPYLEFLGPEHYYEEDEWLHIPSNDPMIRISLSICYDPFTAADLRINATSHGNRTEPILGWNAARKGAEYDTLAIRRQLDTTRPLMTLEERGIISLERRNWTVPVYGFPPSQVGWLIEFTRPQSVSTYNFSSLMCMSCSEPLVSYQFAHQAQAAVFNDIVRDTRHPALALQAHYTTLFSMAYYEHAFQFDHNTSATTSSVEEALAPTGRTGFTMVVTVLAVHLFMVALIVWLFATQGGNSMIGNAWSIFSQLRTGDIEKWTSTANGMTDGEVKKEMERQGRATAWVGFRPNVHGDYFVEQEIPAKGTSHAQKTKLLAVKRATW
jgi:hypothetical protein